ncbi:Plasmodium exported protein, unknown function [Plasmodium vivax]|uniref:Uncharacterized protein n=1 Tax=Plasmodium vivax TaxID=5855 RepID=A0A564ZR23_PLAVI|nr:Plasmodium exported protein, unknown function [Plasmodium vivax]
MVMLRNNNIREYIKYLFFIKILLFTFVLSIYQPYDDCTLGKCLKEKYYYAIIINIKHNRLLAKHDIQKGLEHKGLKDNYIIHGKNNDIHNKKDKSTYGHVKIGGLYHLDAYKKGYKGRYSKKKGLAKMDCYLERKMFDKIEYIDELAENIKNKKKSFINAIFNKYTIRFAIFALLPLIGIIIPKLCGKEESDIIPLCFIDCDKHKTASYNAEHAKKFHNISLTENDFGIITYLNITLGYLLLAVLLIGIFYAFIKIVKYEKLKAGKGKLSMKQYCSLCKDVFI